MTTDFPYIPNLERLLDTYQEVIDSPCYPDMEEDGYFSFLYRNGYVFHRSGFIRDSEKISGGTKEALRLSFWEAIRSESVVKEVLTMIEAGAKASVAEIVDALKDSFSANEVLTYLAWLERLNQIRMKDGHYVIAEGEPADAEDMEYSEGIYPFSYTTGAVDIDEAKYSVFEYLRKLQRGDIKMDPEFQRNQVWKVEQKSRFVESLLLQLPIPPLYLKRDAVGKFVVIDGLQRTTALADFIDNKFVLTGLNALSDLNGKSFKDLQEDGGIGYPDRG